MLNEWRRSFAVISLLTAVVQGCASFSSTDAVRQATTSFTASSTAKHSSDEGRAGTRPAASTVPSVVSDVKEGKPAKQDCDALPLPGKEACYANYEEAALVECERTRPYSCAPYARMHRVEAELMRANDALLKAMRNAYAAYEHDQPGYLKDAETAFAVAGSTWHAYRDAHCELVPLLEGMSRRELPGMTEACRAAMTEARIQEIEERISSLFAEGAANDQQESRPATL